MSLLQQKLVTSPFSNAIMSFSAALGLRSSDLTWHNPGSYTPLLSALIYCNQVLLTKSVLLSHPPQDNPTSSSNQLTAILREWNTNASYGPVSELLYL
jgi:hypothetical protein